SLSERLRNQILSSFLINDAGSNGRCNTALRLRIPVRGDDVMSELTPLREVSCDSFISTYHSGLQRADRCGGGGKNCLAKKLETIWPIDPNPQSKHTILRRYWEAWLPIMTKYNLQCVVMHKSFKRFRQGERAKPACL